MDHYPSHEYLVTHVTDTPRGDFMILMTNLNIKDKSINKTYTYTGKFDNYTKNGWHEVVKRGKNHIYSFEKQLNTPVGKQPWNVKYVNTPKGQKEIIDGDAVPVHVREYVKPQPEPKKEFRVFVEDPNGLFTWEG